MDLLLETKAFYKRERYQPFRHSHFMITLRQIAVGFLTFRGEVSTQKMGALTRSAGRRVRTQFQVPVTGLTKVSARTARRTTERRREAPLGGARAV